MGTHLREHRAETGHALAKRLDRRQPDPAELGSATIQRILVVSCTAIGDTLMSTPAIRSLRLAYPHAHLTLLIHPAYRELFASLPGVNAMLGYRGGWKGFVRLALTLHRQSFDLAVILHGNEPQATPLAYLSGARWIFKLPNAGNPFQFLLSNRETTAALGGFPARYRAKTGHCRLGRWRADRLGDGYAGGRPRAAVGG
ncbi:MAG: hypothetical protein U1E47_00890 [Rivihabitans pingtungensis]